MKAVALSDPDCTFPFTSAGEKDENGYLRLPKWVCQPCIRPETLTFLKSVAKPNEDGQKEHPETAQKEKEETNGSGGSEVVGKRQRTHSEDSRTESKGHRTAASPTKLEIQQAKKLKKKHNMCAQCPNVKSPNCTLGSCKNCCTVVCNKAFAHWPEELLEKFGAAKQKRKEKAKGTETAALEGENDASHEGQGADLSVAASTAKKTWELVTLCEGHGRKAKVRVGRFGGIENGKATLLNEA
jgi:hypothetical protein